MSDPILIIAALNGTRERKIAKSVPYTADELAKEAKRAVDAGAGVVHIHARKADGTATFDLTFDDVVAAIRKTVDVPISITTQRFRQTSLGTVTALFDVLRDLPELATVNVTQQSPESPAHREEARQILEACERAKVRPEPGINSLEAIADVEALYGDGLLAQAPWMNLELGGPAALNDEYKLAGTPRNLVRLVDAIAGGGLAAQRWVAHGEGLATAGVCATAAALGGHIRVGLEDTALLPDGTPAQSNAELVELAVALADSLGREPMEPADVRQMLR